MGQVDEEPGAHVDPGHLVELRLLEPVPDTHRLDQVSLLGASVDLLVRGRDLVIARPLLHNHVEEEAGHGAEPEHHQHDVAEAGHVLAAQVVVTRHPEEGPGDQEDGDVADDGHGVPDGGQTRPLVLIVRHARNQGQVADLNTIIH